MPLPQHHYRELQCAQCRAGAGLDFEFSFAFQPVVDAVSRTVVAYEALVRGQAGESAASILQRVHDSNVYQFDQACRVKAIALAAQLGIKQRLNINFLPNAVYRPELCIRTTLEAARQYGVPIEDITFEFTENEQVRSGTHLSSIVAEYKKMGFLTALDDFGAGYAGLQLLAEFQTDIIKIDRLLLQNIDQHHARQCIVDKIINLCDKLNIKVVAEGVETRAEYHWLRQAGLRVFQGFYFARPGFETLPTVDVALFDR